MSGHRQKKIKRNRGFNITGVTLHCQFGCTVGAVMLAWKKRKVWLEMGGGEGGKEKTKFIFVAYITDTSVLSTRYFVILKIL
jgi:hypothetical protein